MAQLYPTYITLSTQVILRGKHYEALHRPRRPLWCRCPCTADYHRQKSMSLVKVARIPARFILAHYMIQEEEEISVFLTPNYYKVW